MKKVIIIFVIWLLMTILALFAYKFFSGAPDVPDNAIGEWLEVCEGNANCRKGVEKHYSTCANSISFEKPKTKSDLSEYMALTKMELESCFSEKIGKDFPVD